LLDAGSGEVERTSRLAALQMRPGIRALDETGGVHDDVHVRFRFRVLGVIEIEHRLAAKDPDRHGRHLTVDGAARDLAALDEPRGRERQRDVAARDRGRARAAVGLQDVAVDGDGVLA
jgi:hypothetical protein